MAFFKVFSFVDHGGGAAQLPPRFECFGIEIENKRRMRFASLYAICFVLAASASTTNGRRVFDTTTFTSTTTTSTTTTDEIAAREARVDVTEIRTFEDNTTQVTRMHLRTLPTPASTTTEVERDGTTHVRRGGVLD